MKIMKKALVLSLAGTLLLSSVQPKRSEAIILLIPVGGIALFSASAGNVALIVAGIISGTLAVGTSVYSVAETPHGDDLGSRILSCFLLGAVVMDQQGSVTPQFTPMDAATAAQLGVNDGQMAAYNQELDEINAVFQDATVKADAQSSAPNMTQSGLVSLAHSMWSSESQALISPDALAAVNAMAAPTN